MIDQTLGKRNALLMHSRHGRIEPGANRMQLDKMQGKYGERVTSRIRCSFRR